MLIKRCQIAFLGIALKTHKRTDQHAQGTFKSHLVFIAVAYYQRNYTPHNVWTSLSVHGSKDPVKRLKA